MEITYRSPWGEFISYIAHTPIDAVVISSEQLTKLCVLTQWATTHEAYTSLGYSYFYAFEYIYVPRDGRLHVDITKVAPFNFYTTRRIDSEYSFYKEYLGKE